MSLYEHTILYIQKTDLLTRRKQVRFFCRYIYSNQKIACKRTRCVG